MLAFCDCPAGTVGTCAKAAAAMPELLASIKDKDRTKRRALIG
jgi:uncharacterized Zn finger protein